MRIIPSENPRPLNLLAVGPGGLIAAASRAFGAGDVVEVWDATTGAIRFAHTMRDNLYIRGLALATDRVLIGVYDKRITACDLESGNEVEPPPTEGVDSVFALAADGSRLLTTSFRDIRNPGCVVECRVVERGAYRLLWFADFECIGLPVVAVSRSYAAIKSGESEPRQTQRISIRETETGKQIALLALEPASPVQQLAFTADGAKLLVRTDSRTVQLFDAATGAAAGELVHPGRSYVTGIAVHPRGPVACARTNGTVAFWDADTREPLRTLDWKAGKLVSVAFSPDGALGAAGTEDGKVVVWDVDP